MNTKANHDSNRGNNNESQNITDMIRYSKVTFSSSTGRYFFRLPVIPTIILGFIFPFILFILIILAMLKVINISVERPVARIEHE